MVVLVVYDPAGSRYVVLGVMAAVERSVPGSMGTAVDGHVRPLMVYDPAWLLAGGDCAVAATDSSSSSTAAKGQGLQNLELAAGAITHVKAAAALATG